MPALAVAVHCHYHAAAAVFSKSTAHPTETISWEYVGLAQVRLNETPYGPSVRLLCYEDEGSGHFEVSCEYADFAYLRPYMDLLADAATGATEHPVIPVYRDNGRAKFAIYGAQHDYPELGAILQRVINRLSLRRRRDPS